MTHPYLSKLYAGAFGNGYEPVRLEALGGYVLKRPIAGTDYADAMGCYPLCPLAENAALEKDFEMLAAQGIVSLVLVTDPFFAMSVPRLEQLFDKVRVAYKEHFVIDFTQPEFAYSKHHRDRVRKAVKSVEVRKIALRDHLDEWCALYDGLVQKRGVTGIQAFSRHYFEALCALEPEMFGGFSEGRLVCAHLCLQHAGHGYSHLTASSEEGYKLRATFAVYDFTFRHFAEHGGKMFDLGGGAGVENASEGLAQFKQGFSNATRPCHLVGKIINPAIYEKLSAVKQSNFFPAYRG